MYTPKLLSHGYVEIIRERTLPVKGMTHVQNGELVRADQVVLSTELKGDLTIIRIMERLGISQEEAQKGIQVTVGDAVKKGYILFKKKGLFGYFEESVMSPVDGTIEFIIKETAHIAIRSAPELLEVPAYIPGTVISTSSDRQVLIQSHVGILQGVFGLGGERTGVVYKLPVSDNEIITEDHLKEVTEEKVNGGILGGGMSISEEAFHLACKWNASCIVTGSLKSSFIKEIIEPAIKTHPEKCFPSIIITEGFGLLPISKKASRLLELNNKKKASVSGKTQIRAGAIRPEVIFHEPDLSLPLLKEESASAPSIGDHVRIVRGIHFGKTGVITDLPKNPGKLESGVVARVAHISLEEGKTKEIALANLECM